MQASALTTGVSHFTDVLATEKNIALRHIYSHLTISELGRLAQASKMLSAIYNEYDLQGRVKTICDFNANTFMKKLVEDKIIPASSTERVLKQMPTLLLELQGSEDGVKLFLNYYETIKSPTVEPKNQKLRSFLEGLSVISETVRSTAQEEAKNFATVETTQEFIVQALLRGYKQVTSVRIESALLSLFPPPDEAEDLEFMQAILSFALGKIPEDKLVEYNDAFETIVPELQPYMDTLKSITTLVTGTKEKRVRTEVGTTRQDLLAQIEPQIRAQVNLNVSQKMMRAAAEVILDGMNVKPRLTKIQACLLLLAPLAAVALLFSGLYYAASLNQS